MLHGRARLATYCSVGGMRLTSPPKARSTREGRSYWLQEQAPSCWSVVERFLFAPGCGPMLASTETVGYRWGTFLISL
jgi:hypothetical protein